MQRKWKRRWQRLTKIILPPVAAGLLFLNAYSPAFANPSGGTVVNGSAVINASGSTMTVNQITNKAVINWQGFSIGKGEMVSFVQPSAGSVALNRVTGSDASAIYGRLNANGKVFLINPNGILFAPGSQVNVGGLVASAMNIADSDFVSGRYTFSGSGPGSVTNAGAITAASEAVLIGPQVKNQGVIAAKVTGLAAGNRVALDFSGDKLLNVTVDTGAAGGSVTNSGTILADGGLVVMTTGTKEALLSTVVNNSGVIRAQTVNNESGVIKLLGGTMLVGGTLDASAPGGGDGGFIDTSGAKVNIAPDTKVTTLAPGGKTGLWLIDPNDFTIAASGGNMTAKDVADQLFSTNVEIQTATMGTAGGNGDIFVNQDVYWYSNNKLTLTAQRNININAYIQAIGDSAGLVLNSGSGGYNLNGGAKIYLTGSNSTFKLNGTDYTVINSLAALQNMKNNPAGKNFLGDDIYAYATGGWNSGAGFAPISFTGVFDGGGHPIDALIINRPAEDYVGLFSITGGTAVIRNVYLTHVNIIGRDYVGSLAGENNGGISNVYSAGDVVSNAGSKVGGLVGWNIGYLANAYNACAVSGISEVGGLVGRNNGYITNAYNTGNVSSGSYDFAGGIAGVNGQSIAYAYSTGTVTGRNNVGGLVGNYNDFFYGSVSHSYYATTNKIGQPINPSSGNTNKAGEPKTLTELKDPATFAGWSIDDQGGTGNVWRIYSGNTTPLLRSFLTPLTIKAAPGGKTYDGSVAAGSNLSYAPSDGLISGSLSYITTGKNAGTYRTTDGTLTLFGLYSGQRGYDISYDASLTISKAALTVVGLTGSVTKTYDGNTSASLTAGNYTLSGYVSGDSVSVANTAGSYDSKNAGSGKTVTVNGLTLSGADKDNYYITNTGSVSGAVGVINPAALTVGLTGSVTKTYDGDDSAVLTAGNYMFAGYVSGDSVSVANTAGSYNSKNAGSNKLVTINSLALSGADKDNYYITNTGGSVSGAVGVINRRDITISAAAAAKTYDGTAASGLTPAASWLAAGDTVSGVQQYSDKNAGGGKTLTVISYAINDGNGGSNYNVTAVNTNTGGIINPAALTVGLTGSVTKTYDGDDSSVLTAGNYTLGGYVSGDNVSVANTAGSYNSKNAGSNKLVTVNGLTLSGADKDNYYITNTGGSVSGAVGVINQAALTVGLTGSVTKTYDGDDSAVLTAGNYMFAGYVSGDSVSVANMAGSYDSKNAGSSKLVTVNSLALSGADKDNYYIANTGGSVSGAVGVINRRDITISAAAAAKTYDGTAASGLTPAASWLAAGDTVSGVQQYSDKNAGSGKTLTVTSFAINDGNGGDNYNVTAVNTNTDGVINRRDITISAAAAAKTYDGTVASGLTPTASWLAAGDTVGGVQQYSDKNAGSGKTLTVISYAINDGNGGSNYNVTAVNTNTGGIINQAALTVGLTGSVIKAYDGDDSSVLTAGNYTLGGYVSGDSVSVANTAGSYNSKNAGSSKLVTVNSLALSGADKDNYYITNTGGSVSGAVGVINQRDITISAAAAAKTYDGTAASSLTPAASWLAAGDTLSGVQKYSDKNAGTGKTLTVTSYALSDGNGGNNYNVTAVNTNTAGVINQAALTVGLTGSVTKTYDGDTTASLGSANYTLAGAVGGDTVSVANTSGSYDSKHAGVGKTVSVNGLTLTGADSGNYTITNPGSSVTGAVGTIQKRDIAITAVTDTKTYDGTATSSLTPAASWLAAGDTVSGTQQYSDKNAGSGKTLTVTGYAINDGNNGNNYNVTAVNTNTNGSIDQAALTVGLTGSVTKTYDGDDSAVLTAGNYALAGYVSGDSVSVAYTAGSYDSKNAGSSKLVTVNSLALSGADKDNYYIANTGGSVSGAVGVINRRDITISATAAAKTYDGTAASGVTPAASWLAAGDTVSGVQQYSDKNAGSGKTLTVISYAINDGNGGGNYNVTAVNGNTDGVINRANLTVTADSAVRHAGQTNPGFAASYSGLVGDDTPASLTGSLAFGTTATPSSGQGAYAITLTGTLSSPNYNISYVDGVLTILGWPANPVYDGAVSSAIQQKTPSFSWSPLRGYPAGTNGAYVPLSITAPGINIHGYTGWTDTLNQTAR